MVNEQREMRKKVYVENGRLNEQCMRSQTNLQYYIATI